MSTNPVKVVALDVYGTILAFDDNDYSCAPRRGLECFFDKCDEKRIKIVTSSDGFTGSVKNDLAMAFKFALQIIINPEVKKKMQERLRLDRFDGFFQLGQGIKDFSVIIGHYDILPRELLVVGDNFNKDIYGALRLGARAIHCPVYGVDQGRDWDFGKIDLNGLGALA